MSFITLMGGILVFGFLWLLMPRVSFIVALALYLKCQHGVEIFTIPSQSSNWNVIAEGLIMVSVFFGLILDIYVCRNAFFKKK